MNLSWFLLLFTFLEFSIKLISARGIGRAFQIITAIDDLTKGDNPAENMDTMISSVMSLKGKKSKYKGNTKKKFKSEADCRKNSRNLFCDWGKATELKELGTDIKGKMEGLVENFLGEPKSDEEITEVKDTEIPEQQANSSDQETDDTKASEHLELYEPDVQPYHEIEGIEHNPNYGKDMAPNELKNQFIVMYSGEIDLFEEMIRHETGVMNIVRNYIEDIFLSLSSMIVDFNEKFAAIKSMTKEINTTPDVEKQSASNSDKKSGEVKSPLLMTFFMLSKTKAINLPSLEARKWAVALNELKVFAEGSGTDINKNLLASMNIVVEVMNSTKISNDWLMSEFKKDVVLIENSCPNLTEIGITVVNENRAVMNEIKTCIHQGITDIYDQAIKLSTDIMAVVDKVRTSFYFIQKCQGEEQCKADLLSEVDNLRELKDRLVKEDVRDIKSAIKNIESSTNDCINDKLSFVDSIYDDNLDKWKMCIKNSAYKIAE